MTATRPAAAQSAPETGGELLARILTERRKSWQGRGQCKDPAAPDTAKLPPLPRTWTWATVGQLGQTTTGFTPPKQDASLFGGDIPFFKPSDLDVGYNVREFRDSLTEAGAEHGRVLPPLSILVTCIGATIGKTGLARVRCTTNQQINALTVPTDLVSPHFVYWYFNTSFGQRQITENASATTLPILNKSRFEALPIPLAPLPEQRQIVAEIEKQSTRLEVGVAALQRVHANLKRYRAAVLKAASEGRLVPTEAELAKTGKHRSVFESGESLLARILTERRQNWNGCGKYKEPASPKTTNLPRLPDGWTWATPDQLADAGEGAICAGPFGTIFKAKDFRPVGVPIIFLRHVAPGRYLTHKPGFMDDARWKDLFHPYSVYGGELLITKLGEPPGVCAIYPVGIGPAMVTPDVMKMTPNPVAALPMFLMHYFNSQTARDFATGVAFGTTRLRLTLPIFREMPVPLPPLVEQSRIVSEVERRLSVVEELERVVSANLQRATRLRQSVLQKAFTGGL